MLKKYIQALLEGFLASKRAWVGTQSYPKPVDPIVIEPPKVGVWGNKYVAPSNGEVSFYVDQASACFVSYLKPVLSNYLMDRTNSLNLDLSFTIRVVKGEEYEVFYATTNGNPSKDIRFHFAPDIGSEN